MLCVGNCFSVLAVCVTVLFCWCFGGNGSNSFLPCSASAQYCDQHLHFLILNDIVQNMWSLHKAPAPIIQDHTSQLLLLLKLQLKCYTNSMHFTDPEGLFPYLVETSSGSCPEPVYLPYIRSILTALFHLCHGLPNFWFSSSFLSKTIYVFLISPICVACPTFLVLDFVSQIISGVKWKLWCLLLAIIFSYQWNMKLPEHWNKCI